MALVGTSISYILFLNLAWLFCSLAVALADTGIQSSCMLQASTVSDRSGRAGIRDNHDAPSGPSSIRTRSTTESPFVIVGIGDSGTRGVQSMMKSLGVAMCNQTTSDSDAKQTMATNRYIKPLLEAARGQVSSTAGYMSSHVFHQAVQTERAASKQILDCVIKQNGLKNDSLPAGFRFGYKNPNHLYLLPVMDKAFDDKQKILAVARDPRDLCTAHNQGQLKQLGDYIQFPKDLKKDSWHMTKCLQFWAATWTSVLREYASNSNFLVVRIEDLATHDPTKSHKSHDTLKRVMEHAGISSSMNAMQEQLQITHQYKDSYMGHHYGMTDKRRKELEDEVASYTGNVHDVMGALGYHVDHYGLVEPKHPRVVSPPSETVDTSA